MRFIIDRFEGAFAVCEMQDGRSFGLPRGLLSGIGEGESVRVVSEGNIIITSSDGKKSVLAAEGMRAAVPSVVTEGFSVGDTLGFVRDDENCTERKEKIERLMDELFEE